MAKTTRQLSTRDQILEAAERLFAERGLDRTSLREITVAARVNLASVNYHFGSKDGLIAAVFQRYLGPLNEARLQMLDAVEAAAGDSAPTLEAVLEAFIGPAVSREVDSRHTKDAFLLLMGRCLSEPPIYVEKYVLPHCEGVMQRFEACMGRILPDLPHHEICWRMTFTIGALHHALLVWSRLSNLPFMSDQPVDPEGFLHRLVAFTAAGLRSPVADLRPGMDLRPGCPHTPPFEQKSVSIQPDVVLANR